jgi:heme oxygenase
LNNIGLAELLKIETRALHGAAERSVFLAELLHGRMDRPAYCALLRNLHAIYVVLEQSLERHAQHPMIGPIFLPALWRTGALERDLLALHGAAWVDELALQPSAATYVGRLRDLDAAQPGLLVAHAYVRYLGDLSGGQMMRSVVETSAAVNGAGAVAFYDFGDGLATQALTQAFRHGLGAIPVDHSAASALVLEARLAFDLHQRLFAELAAACGLTARPEARDR